MAPVDQEKTTPPAAGAGEPLAQRALRFGRALVVGSGATLVDVSVLTTSIHLVGLAPTAARVPALLAGASFQFFGNRSFTFRAQRGKLTRQARLFVACEAIALLINWSLFRFLSPRITAVPQELVSFLGTFVVFVAFAYPMRKLVIFRLRPDEGGARS